MSKVFESFIYGNDQISSDVINVLNQRTNFQSYSIQEKNPWITVTSGIKRNDQSEFIKLKGARGFDNFTDLYDEESRPIPVVNGIETKYLDDVGSVKEIEINITFHSKNQMQKYEPYFMLLGNSILIEWGIYNEARQYEIPTNTLNSFLDLEGESSFYKLTEKRKQSSDFKYNNFLGIITSYNIDYDGDNIYNVKVGAYSIGYFGNNFPLNKTGYDITKTINEKAQNFTLTEYIDNVIPTAIESIAKGSDKNVPKRLFDSLVARFPTQNDWQKTVLILNPDEDGTTETHKFVSMGFVETLVNHMCSLSHVDSDNQKLYTISSIFKGADKPSSYVSNVEGLKSTDISKCFIYKGNGYGDKINSFSSSDGSKFGEWVNIYISLEEAQLAIKNSDNVNDLFNSLYSLINSCFVHYWDFRLIYDEALQQIYTVDLKQLKNSNQEAPTKPFIFKTFGGKSFIKNLSFSTSSTSDQNLQTLYASRSNVDKTKGDINNEGVLVFNYLKNQYKDVLFKSGELTTLYDKDNDDPDNKLKTTSSENNNVTDPKDITCEKLNEQKEVYGSTYGWLYEECQLKYITDNEKYNTISDLNELLKQLIAISISQKNSKINPLMPVEVEFEIDGMSGLKLGNILKIDALPDRYNDNGVLQIIELTDSVNKEGWITRIKTLYRFTGDIK